MGKKQESIWKFNDEEWKVHITSEQLKEEAKKTLILKNQVLFIMKMVTFKKRLHGI